MWQIYFDVMCSGDYGIFNGKFTEFMMQNKSHQLVQPCKIKDYMEKYAVKLYHHADIKT